MATKVISFTETESLQTDFSRWDPAGRSDSRSPCPMLNALANHHLLPHDGRGLTKAMVQEAASKIGADRTNIGKIFEQGASPVPGYTKTGRIDLVDLARNGVLEHDTSLSRQDTALGDNLPLDKLIWMSTLQAIGDRETIDYATAAKIRHMRFMDSTSDHKAAHVKSNFDLKALAIAYVELATAFRIFADTSTGELPVKYFRTLVEEERIHEEWHPYMNADGRPGVPKIALSIIWAEKGFWKVFLYASMVSARKAVSRVLSFLGIWKAKTD